MHIYIFIYLYTLTECPHVLYSSHSTVNMISHGQLYCCAHTHMDEALCFDALVNPGLHASDSWSGIMKLHMHAL